MLCVQIHVRFGVQGAESVAQLGHQAHVVRLEQAREVGGQEDDAPPGGGIDDDVGPRPATLQEPGRDLLGIRIPHHALAGDRAGDISDAAADEVTRRPRGRRAGRGGGQAGPEPGRGGGRRGTGHQLSAREVHVPSFRASDDTGRRAVSSRHTP